MRLDPGIAPGNVRAEAADEGREVVRGVAVVGGHETAFWGVTPRRGLTPGRLSADLGDGFSTGSDTGLGAIF